jgi:hypothetical protein
VGVFGREGGGRGAGGKFFFVAVAVQIRNDHYPEVKISQKRRYVPVRTWQSEY